MHMGKKVVCIKDIPSNLIEEAIFILKTDTLESKKENLEIKTKEIILNEAEEIVNEYERKYESDKKLENEKKIEKYNRIKKEALYYVGLFVIACIVISIVI